MDLSNAVVWAAFRANELLKDIENEYSLWSKISRAAEDTITSVACWFESARDSKCHIEGFRVVWRWFDGCLFLSGIELTPTLKLVWIWKTNIEASFNLTMVSIKRMMVY